MSNPNLDHTGCADNPALATENPPAAVVGDETTTSADVVVAPRRARGPLRTAIRGALYLAIAGLLLFTARTGRNLWLEYLSLQEILSHDAEHEFIGFVDVYPNPSRAVPPQRWFVSDEHGARLWGGWQGKQGHVWFELGPGEIDPAKLSGPLGGRDTFRAIDVPLVEVGGGEVWQRIPDNQRVVCFRWGETDVVYPMMVLSQVIVVHDVIGNRPLLIVHDKADVGKDDGAVHVVDGMLDGNRILFSHCGYLLNRSPLLFDRDTESLWVPTSDGLQALAGPRKGTTLPRVDVRPRYASWSDTRDAHAGARLLVGAERPAIIRYATDAVPVHYKPPAPTAPQDNVRRTSTNLSRSIQ